MSAFLSTFGHLFVTLVAPSEVWLLSCLRWLRCPLLIPNNQEIFPSSLRRHIFWIQLETSPSEISKCLLQISNMIFLLHAFNYDVINICQHILADLRVEDFGSHPAKASSSILEPLGHPKVAVGSTGGYESCLGRLLSSSKFDGIMNNNPIGSLALK
jgi:hypothetical protein